MDGGPLLCRKLSILPALLLACCLAAPLAGEGPVRWRTVSRTYPVRGAERNAVTVTNVVLENDLLRVEVAPELAGRIMHVVYRGSGRELYNVNDEVLARIPWDAGGWRASFPFPEHGMRFRNQSCGWRVIPGDGTVTLAMDNRFTHFRSPQEVNYQGRYTVLRLGRRVTLRPGQAYFECAIAVENPMPFRVGYHLWTTAQFPEAPDARFVLPVSRVSFHRAEWFRDWTPGQGAALYRNWSSHASYFSVGMEQPFAAVYYPGTDINRIRIADPEPAPGAKLFGFAPGRNRYFEIWTGNQPIFEQPGELLPAFGTGGFTERGYLVAGLGGPVTYADRHLAVRLLRAEGTGGSPAVLRLATAHLIEQAVVKASGSKDVSSFAGTLRPGKVCALKLDAPPGERVRLRVFAAGELLTDCELPPSRPPVSHEAERRIRRSIYPPKGAPAARAVGAEKRGWIRFGFNDSSSPTLDTTGLAAARRWRREQPDSVEARVVLGRIALRAGLLEEAAAALKDALDMDAERGSAHHLLGLVLLEQGSRARADAHFRAAVRCERPHMPAHYFVALAHIGDGKLQAASDALSKLVNACPDLLRPRLALAATLLKLDRPEAAGEIARDALRDAPAAVEAAEVWARCEPDDETRRGQVRKLLESNPGAAAAMDRFRREIDDGLWRRPPRPENPHYIPGKQLNRTESW
jgi:tetratricopeptide (TPR) repeat protein